MGADGAQRAKFWLDATTRTRSTWTNEDAVIAARMTFEWPFGTEKHQTPTTFSFDIGGILFGDPFDNHQFVAEVKNYSTTGNIGSEFDDFLAKCYRVATTSRQLADQFMFITWNPFRAQSWKKQTETEQIREGCIINRERLLGEKDKEKASELIDDEAVSYVRDRLWLVVLSDKQEALLISDEDRAMINAERTKRRQM